MMQFMKFLVFNFICVVFHFALLKADVVVFYDHNEVDIFLDSEWPFALPIMKYGIEGVMIHSNPVDACSNITRPPQVNSSLNWFVLIAGSSCDYGTKIMHSELAGYSAAVIYMGQRNFLYRHPSRHVPFVNISAVVIGTRSGHIIKEKYLYTINERFRFYIYPNVAFNVMTFLLLFAIVAGIFIFMMFAFMIVRCMQGARRALNNRLSIRHLRQLVTSRYKNGDPYETCAICLEDYKENDKLRILPCSHGYHSKCIDPWLTNSRQTCPICNQKVVLDGENIENDSDSDTESRAETVPLLRNVGRVYQQHGTFNTSTLAYQQSSSIFHEDMGETTSRDATSDAFDETSEEENFLASRYGIDSAVQVDFPIRASTKNTDSCNVTSENMLEPASTHSSSDVLPNV